MVTHDSLISRLEPPRQAALARLWSILPAMRLVGGVVRDLLADRAIADIDLATPEPPEQVMERLRAQDVHVVATGLQHGTVTAVMDGAPYEITTLRCDVETDGRHAVVRWTQDWRADALRRDFTINAMSVDRAGVLYDYFAGQADLAAGHVRFVGQPALRIEEDALRILRFFRFYGRYGRGQPDQQALYAISCGVALLDGLSVERVWMELQRILVGPNVAAILRLMENTGVLARILPEGHTLERCVRLLDYGAPGHALLRLAGLSAAPLAVARRLKMSRAQTGLLAALNRSTPMPDVSMSDDALRRLVADEPHDVLEGRIWLHQAATPRTAVQNAAFAQLRSRLRGIEAPVFPIAGRDVLAMGGQAGPEVGRIIGLVRQWWLDGGCRAGAHACRMQIKHLLDAKAAQS
ncbi:CCA tRNA nucleotidyltransferase [Acetobacter lambici]|uniref:CCA tRNA nucleotidyltransferase n=1 Tax=Acetobacter lambici TaxID=1332824 RepID=UPI0020A2B2F4|nr:CCA tRNA nucleotidyltransferase [Acetobacter lambici]